MDLEPRATKFLNEFIDLVARHGAIVAWGPAISPTIAFVNRKQLRLYIRSFMKGGMVIKKSDFEDHLP